MKIELEFKYHRSHRAPFFKVWFNQTVLCDINSDDCIPNRFCWQVLPLTPMESNSLIIEHYDKSNNDTVLDQDGNVTHDRALEIVSINIDGFLQPWNALYSKKFWPIWPAHMTNQPDFITNTLYLGFNGKYVFDFPSRIDQSYYDSLWEQERDINIKATKTDADNDGIFTAYGMQFKMDQKFNFDLSQLKRLIEDNEKI